ncbi:glycosyltransferase family 4 protein [Chloroflexales bacterium ZM16-3]|nr:glycosyltransferase family 4 protein [Chloroflexales bacterium ZM16-3]
MEFQSSHKPSPSGLLSSQGRSGSVRVLFLHAALDHLSAEYKVHKVLAESADSHGVESFFIWQRGARSTGDNAIRFAWPERVRYLDFGRDLSTSPQVGRLGRGLRMLRSLPGATLALLAYVRTIQPDLIYTSQQIYDVRIARIISRLTRVPHVIHIHYTVGHWLGGDVMKAMHQNPRLIAVSEFIRQNAMLQGINPSDVSTVPNSIDPEVFQHTGDRAALRAEFGWEPDTPVLLSAGRLDQMKGHLQLLDRFALVRAQMPHARLLICGRMQSLSNYPDLLHQRVIELGLQGSVAFAGHRYDLPEIMRAADVFVLLSEMEPFGLVFLEAMAARLPVVAYYSGAIPEIVVDGVTGLLSYPEHPEPLVQNLVRLLSNRSLASQLGAAGSARAANHFSSERIAPLWATLIYRFAGKVAPISIASAVG